MPVSSAYWVLNTKVHGGYSEGENKPGDCFLTTDQISYVGYEFLIK